MNLLSFLEDKCNIDLLIVAIVLLSGFFQKKYLCKWQISKDEKFDSALKTLGVSFVVALTYVLLKYKGAELQWAKYFISYFFATSLYELLVKPFYKALRKALDEPAV